MSGLFLMVDIKSPTPLYAKGAMMLAVGILASTLLLLRHPKATTAWASER
jgi:hypothetical protein